MKSISEISQEVWNFFSLIILVTELQRLPFDVSYHIIYSRGKSKVSLGAEDIYFSHTLGNKKTNRQV